MHTIAAIIVMIATLVNLVLILRLFWRGYKGAGLQESARQSLPAVVIFGVIGFAGAVVVLVT